MSASCWGETLTDMVVDSGTTPSSIQLRSWLSDSRITHAPISSMRPVSSAIEMKSIGGVTVPSPRRHRINASTPSTVPCATSMIG